MDTTHQRTKWEQGYCLCKNKVCGFTQQKLSRYTGPIPSCHKGSAAEWCKPDSKPIKVHFDPDKSNYQSWLLILSICYHIPDFLTAFNKDVVDVRLSKNQGERQSRKQWLINRIHFPGALLVHRQQKKYGLLLNTSVMLPGVAKLLEGLDRSGCQRKRMTDHENTLGYLEQYAEGILPTNLYQVFLQSKRKLKNELSSECLVQAPVISLTDVFLFCRASKIPTTTYTDATIINIVPTGRRLVMAAPPPPASRFFKQPPRTLATIQRNGIEVILASDDGSQDLPRTGKSLPMTHGGNVTVYPRMLEAEDAVQLTKDLMADPGVFFLNKVCGFNDEPRVQAHFHSEATEDFNQPQPGYRYGGITLKARPVHRVPSLCQLAERCGLLCKVKDWSIGTTVVLYRNGKDYMGFHKGTYILQGLSDLLIVLTLVHVFVDNDQGETLILAVVVDAPDSNIRKVEIHSDLKDEKIVLYLRRGDGYAMDGEMQKNYTHGVPAAWEERGNLDHSQLELDPSDQRISIVFRQGRKTKYKKASGKPCTNLKPCTSHGSNPVYGAIFGLQEGHLYSREVICKMNAHSSQRRGVSGNKKDGCDAIMVAGKGEVQGKDTILELTYSASTSGGGAEGMLLSQKEALLIRVFRTTTYAHPNRAILPADYGHKQITGAYYRYDGLYEIQKSEEYLVETEDDECRGKKKRFVFQLSRCGIPHNQIGGNDYILLCKQIGTLL